MLRRDLTSKAQGFSRQSAPSRWTRFSAPGPYLAAILIVLLIVSSLPYGALLAQELDGTSRRIARAISASALASGVSRALDALGFSPPEDPKFQSPTWGGYSAWPDVRKIEAAYQAAEASVPESGRELLNHMLRLTAQHNVAVTAEPVFVEHIGEMTSPELRNFRPRRFTFASPPVERLQLRLPIAMENIVRAVVAHQPNIHGGVFAQAISCCGVGPDALYQVLRTAASYEDVLARVLLQGRVPPELEQRVRQLVQHGVRQNVALLDDPAVYEYAVDALHPPREAAGPQRPGWISLNEGTMPTSADPARALDNVVRRPGTGPTPDTVESLTQPLDSSLMRSFSGADQASAQMATQRYSAFQARSYGVMAGEASQATSTGVRTASARGALAFARVRTLRGGFGGVVLGNDVAVAGDIAVPARFRWRSLAPSVVNARSLSPTFRWGYMVISFQDGSVGVTRPMRGNHVSSAVAIVYGGVSDVVAPLFVGDGAGGDAIGLVGYTGSESHNALVDGAVRGTADGVRSFTVHPAILGYPLGQDAILVDAGPFVFPDRLEAMVRESLDRTNDGNRETWERFRRWLYDERDTYKFLDVPLMVMRSELGVMYVVRRSGRGAGWPEALRRSGYLTFQAFRPDGSTTAEDGTFYPIVPALARAWPSFGRLNDFAEVTAFVRWLRANDAMWDGGLEEAERGVPLTTLVAGDQGTFRLERSAFEINFRLAVQVRALAREILGRGAPQNVLDLNDEVHQARVERLAAIEAQRVWDLEAIGDQELVEDLRNAREDFWALGRGLWSSGGGRRLLARMEDVEERLRASVAGRFVGALETSEAHATARSPLENEESARRAWRAYLPDAELEAYQAILGERQRVSDERDRVEEVVRMVNAQRNEGGEVDEPQLLRWLVTDDEWQRIREIDDKLAALNSVICGDGAGFFQRLSGRWEAFRIRRQRNTLLRGLLEQERLGERSGELQTQATTLNGRMDALEVDAERELRAAFARHGVPEFEEWWDLQQSYRVAVFGG